MDTAKLGSRKSRTCGLGVLLLAEHLKICPHNNDSFFSLSSRLHNTVSACTVGCKRCATIGNSRELSALEERHVKLTGTGE